ncbi:MAG: HugZ family pyridoxamine 5'-phosphate oxidase [Pseudomonadota bacterium]
MAAAPDSPARIARALIRAADRASLATLARPGTQEAGAPYASLVLVACDHDASPILLISALADHTRNIAFEARVSLLFDGTAGLAEPLTGARLSLQGRAAATAAPRQRARFLARHPGAATYADFKDFAFYRVAPARAHLVAGFGRIHWLEASDLAFDAGALAEREADIVRHMNHDHADAVGLYANVLLGRPGAGWVVTGIDPEGLDLRRAGEIARLPFERPVSDAEGARAELVRLAERARRDVPRP